jgi:hypothetical protein
MSGQYPLRAMRYLPVAVGQCPACLRHPQILRFSFNPYGDDQLLCVPCADRADRAMAEDAGREGGRPAAAIASDINNAIVEAYNGWPPEVRARFDRVMGEATKRDKKAEEN